MVMSVKFHLLASLSLLAVCGVAVEVDSNGKKRRLDKDPNTASLMRRMRPTGHDYSNAAGATPSRSALMKRRHTTLVVPGHLALAEMAESQNKKADGTVSGCNHVYQKAKALVARRKELADTNGEDPAVTAKLDALKTQIDALEQNEQLMEAFEEDVEDQLNLGDGIMSGVVWTDDDEAIWVDCNEHVSLTNTNGANGVDMQLNLQDGTPLSQGDLAPGLGGNSLLETSLFEAAVQHRRAQSNIWPLKTGDATTHEVPYCFATGLSEEAKKAWMDAVQHTSAQVPCVTFKALTTTAGSNAFADTVQENCATTPSIIVQSTQSGCWSLVGQVSEVAQFAGSSQPINLGKGCENLGIAAHEIGHALGMLHEMSRNDRDTWVTIKKENIASAMMRNFENDTNADSKSPFDFLSLMIYGCYAFSTNGELTIEPHQLALVSMMGQRMGFSQLDIELIGSMYGCLDKVAPANLNKAMSQEYLKNEPINTGFTGTCSDSDKTGFVAADDSPMTCTELRKYCAHDTLGPEIRNLCPVSCYQCVPGLGQGLAPLTGSGDAGNPPPSEPTAAHRSASLGAVLLASLASMVVMDRL